MFTQYIQDNKEYLYKTLKELCLIPAPSHHEQKRAEYCKNWLENIGAKGVVIDEACNVIFPYQCENSSQITVYAAHMDTVFPDMETLPYIETEDKIYCPGVGDDTASLTVLLFLAKYFIEQNIQTSDGILFVCNSCEEGLGNLKGTRQLFKDYEGRIKQFITLDSNMDVINDGCAGSHRYEVAVVTQGGHSFQNFGTANAIHECAKIISRIYEIQVPVKENTKTTYNVGIINGGTSINTIAQSCKLLCEYRSNDYECMAYMHNTFESIFESIRSEDVKVIVTKIGDRPCQNIDPAKIDDLRDQIKPIIEKVIHKPARCKSASTDCNVPLSLGIPALCIGVYYGDGEHTREEWIIKDSIIPGLEIALKVAMELK